MRPLSSRPPAPLWITHEFEYAKNPNRGAHMFLPGAIASLAPKAMVTSLTRPPPNEFKISSVRYVPQRLL